MKIRHKFLLITVGLILLPMAVSTVVVSLVVHRQHDAEAWSRIDDALRFVNNDIELRAHKLAASLRTFTGGKEVTDAIAFILRNEREHSMFPLLAKSGNSLTGEMQKFAAAAEFDRIALHYPDGQLMAVFRFDDGDQRFEFYLHDGQGRPARLNKDCPPHIDCLSAPWREEPVADWPKSPALAFGGEPQVKKTGNLLGLEVTGTASVPSAAGKPPFRTGIVIHKHFNLDYALGLSESTEIDIAFSTAEQARLFPLWNAPEISPAFLDGLPPKDVSHKELQLETAYYGGFYPFSGEEGRLLGVMSTRLSQDTTIARTIEAIAYLVGIALATIALMIPAVMFLSHRFLEPIHALIRGAQAFGSGDLEYRLRESPDEVGDLATAFNSMAESIRHAHQELEKLNTILEEYNRDLEQKIHEATEAIVEKNRVMQEDLDLAAEFQTAILSVIPTTSFLLCAMKYIPYGGGVSGDVYDMSIDRDGAANIFLGDATGHGVAAAIMTMMAQIGLDSLREDLSTDEIIRQLNSLFATRERDMSITGVFMRIAPSGKLSVTNAGHPPVIIVPVDSHTPVHLKEGGTPLGMFREEIAPYVELEYHLKAGDKVFLYTDGITEWLNPEEDEFGIERLTEFLMQNGDTQIDVTLNKLLHYVTRFAKGRPCDDDLTLMGFQYQPI